MRDVTRLLWVCHLVFSVVAHEKPHILLITGRVLSYGTPGGDAIRSPNIDKLAREGVRFTESFVTSPVCGPCRTSLLTGVHVPLHGVVENAIAPERDSFTVYPDVLLPFLVIGP